MTEKKLLMRVKFHSNMKAKKHSPLHQWQQKCKEGTEKCANCGETQRLTVDHIVPVSLINQFMIFDERVNCDFEENFEILCYYCNRRKAANIDPRNPRVYQILEYIINKAKQEHLK